MRTFYSKSRYVRNQSRLSVDGGGGLTLYKPLELIGIYAEIK